MDSYDFPQFYSSYWWELDYLKRGKRDKNETWKIHQIVGKGEKECSSN